MIAIMVLLFKVFLTPKIIEAARQQAEKGLQGRMSHAEAGAKGGRGKKASAIGTSFGRGSNSASHIVRRLKRDHPEIAEALARGEFRSARAAAIAAGIVKQLSPLDQIYRLWAKLTPEERAAFLCEILSEDAAKIPDDFLNGGISATVTEVTPAIKTG